MVHRRRTISATSSKGVPVCGDSGMPAAIPATALRRDEQAFRQIVWGCLAGLPLACWLGQTWGDRVLLALVLVVALLVELLNSAIENVVDRISPELHPLSKKAKDMGSAAQFTAQICILVVWGTYLIGRFF